MKGRKRTMRGERNIVKRERRGRVERESGEGRTREENEKKGEK